MSDLKKFVFATSCKRCAGQRYERLRPLETYVRSGVAALYGSSFKKELGQAVELGKGEPLWLVTNVEVPAREA